MLAYRSCNSKLMEEDRDTCLMNGVGEVDVIEKIEREVGITPLGLFSKFAQSSKLIRNRLLKKQVKNGARAGKMDFPLDRYLFSLGFQIERTNEIYAQFDSVNTEAVNHLKKLEVSAGTGISYKPLIEVTHLFEYYIFLLSRTLSTIGNVNLFVFETEDQCSYNFNKQREKILEGRDIFGPEYTSIIRDMGWYNEVRIVRDNTAHFIGGFTALDKDGPGKPSLIYFSYPILDNYDDDADNIQIDISQAVKAYHEGFNNTLNRIGRCYLKQLEPEAVWNTPDRTYQHFSEIKLSGLFDGKVNLKRLEESYN
jgi:hypothetical protein